MTRRQKKIDDFYLRALNEMFRRVGFESYDEEFGKQPYWYTLREWSIAEDVDFTKWFTEEYRKTFRCSKYIAKGAAATFVFNYGWKLKKEFEEIDDSYKLR